MSGTATERTEARAAGGTRPRWMVLEPYYGGSHRHLVDGLAERLRPEIELELWTLPPRKWKWRMRGAALLFARRWHTEGEHLGDVTGIFTSSLLDAAALRGLLPPPARHLPLVLYCHENQLVYPVRVEDRRDYHYGWTNIQSALAADRLLWNSEFNRDSFLEELPRFVRRMPDERPKGLAAEIRSRSEVLPVPFDDAGFEAAAAETPPKAPSSPIRIAWNHRWEHDKGPETFFRALLRLAERGHPFEVAVLGQSFARRPAFFERARERLGDRVVAWGYAESRKAYAAELARCDVAVSAARHEFQGLAVLEATACGAVPLVPDDLAYREIWPEELRYRRGGLAEALAERIERLEQWRRYDPRPLARRFGWDRLLPRWRELFRAAALSRPGRPGSPAPGAR